MSEGVKHEHDTPFTESGDIGFSLDEKKVDTLAPSQSSDQTSSFSDDSSASTSTGALPVDFTASASEEAVFPMENVSPAITRIRTKHISFYFGLTFSFVFLGYYVAQGYATRLFPASANIGWALIYTMYASASLLAPMIPHLPLRRTLSVCMLVYIGFVASLNSEMDAAYLVACLCVGAAAGFLWFTQGRYMMRLAGWDGETGAINAIFFGLFYGQNVIGSSISLGVLYGGVQLKSLIWIMCGVSFIGVVLSFFIRPVPRLDDLPKVYYSAKTRFRLMWLTLKERCIILLVPLMALQAIGIVMSYQIMPKSVALASPSLDVDVNIAFCFLAYGFGNIFGAFGGGRLFDRNWRYVFWPICGLEVVCCLLIILFNELALGPALIWTVVGFLRGISDTAINALICSVITTLRFNNYVGERPDGLVFGLYRGVYCISFIPVSIMSGYVSYIVIVSLALAFIIASIVFYGFVFQSLSWEGVPPVEAQITPGEAPSALDNLGTLIPSTPIAFGVPVENHDLGEYVDL